MTVMVVEEKFEEPVETLKQKCANCLKGPNLLKTLVVFACTIVVVQQITSCVKKLIDVPITTYNHFDFNKTIMYPSVTFCREPPYRFNKMQEYGLYAHPRFTSVWRNYNFSHSLTDLWDDITYSPSDVFVMYGLDGMSDNVDLHPVTGFVYGRCYTLTPRKVNQHASRDSGYSITLQHSAEDVVTSTSIYPPGYHAFVHFSKEPFTEVEVYNGGLVDYFYINIGETIDVKLSVDEYSKLNQKDDPCNEDVNYSANNCTSQCVWELAVNESGCSGPWMVSQLPHCTNHTTMTNLIVAYMNLYKSHQCNSCARICRGFMYKVIINDRQKQVTWNALTSTWSLRTDEAKLQAQVYMYFNSMMVSVCEEDYNYDWNKFIADLGGSVGFLLGLSVISLMTILSKMWISIIQPFIKVSNTTKSSSSISSSSTAKIMDNDIYKKYYEWSKQNENFI